MKNDLILIGCFMAMVFATSYVAETNASENVKRLSVEKTLLTSNISKPVKNKLKITIYTNGCFDVKRGNKFLLRCA
jgi:hypothetical protein